MFLSNWESPKGLKDRGTQAELDYPGPVTVSAHAPIPLLLSLAQDQSCDFTMATFGMSKHDLMGSS